MKSIQEIRIKNLSELIDREFNGVQTRLAERMETPANLVNRWVLGKKVIGDQVARKIEDAANKPRNWLDIDRSLIQEDYVAAGPSEIGMLAALNLQRWMRNSDKLNSQGKVSRASGIGQSTINRMLNNEASVTIATLESLAEAFGKHGYEMLMHPNDPSLIKYDRERYALLPKSEKDKVESYIDFIISQSDKKPS